MRVLAALLTLAAVTAPAGAEPGQDPIGVREAFQTFINVCMLPYRDGIVPDNAVFEHFGLSEHMPDGNNRSPVFDITVRLFPSDAGTVCAMAFFTEDYPALFTRDFSDLAKQLNPSGNDEIAWVLGDERPGDIARISMGGKLFDMSGIVPAQRGFFGLRLTPAQ